VIRVRGTFLQRGVAIDHLAWNDILADAEVLQRSLRLRAPQFLLGNVDFTEAVAFLSHGGRHLSALRLLPHGGSLTLCATTGVGGRLDGGWMVCGYRVAAAMRDGAWETSSTSASL